MSTNFYLDSADNEAGHVGKRSGGVFIAKAPVGVDSYDQWAAMLDGHAIVGEHGVEYTAETFLEGIQTTDENRDARRRYRTPRASEGEWIERGILFVRYEFC